MTVLYCLSHITKSLQWLWFAEEMQKRGINQIYVLLHRKKWGKNMLYHDLKDLGVEVHLWETSKKSYLKNIVKTRKLIRKQKVHIVHTSLPYGNLIGQIAAMLAGVRNSVSTCENASWAHDFKNKKQEWIDKLTYKLSRKVIAVADSAEEYLKKYFDLNGQKLLTIYHGLKESDYENISEKRVSKLKELYDIRENDFVVGVISRYEFWKGHEFINKAAAILKKRDQHKDIRILIFGSKGSYYETAMQQIEELGISEIVQYKGFCDDPVALFRVFDVHLHVPVNKYVENCGINIIEGMISARPQVLTKSGYAWQSAEHMKNAYVVDYENAEAIADAIFFLKENPDKRRQLALRAKEDALITYGLKTKADKHLALYNELLK